jgi:hypothetical protein
MTIPHRTSLRSVSVVVATERHRGRGARCGKTYKVPHTICFRISQSSDFRIACVSCDSMSSRRVRSAESK